MRNLDGEADRDDPQQRDDKRLDPTKAEILHPQDQEHVERGDQNADLERNAKQQVEADGSANHFREVGRADRNFGEHPQRPRHRARKCVAAGLGEVAA
jgi:hypothetical protein